MLALVILSALGTETIHILDPDGRPVAGASVIPFRFVSYANPQPFPTLTADANGVVDLSGSRAISSVFAFAPGYGYASTRASSPQAAVVPPTLRLARENVLHLRLVDKGGAALSGVLLEAKWLIGIESATRASPRLTAAWPLIADRTGTIVLRGLPRGGGIAFVTPDERFVRELPTLQLDDAATTTRTLSLAWGAMIEGTVRRDGRGASGLQVLAATRDQRIMGLRMTDNQGRYRIAQLPPGAYAVGVRTEHTETVRARGGLILREGARLLGQDFAVEPGTVLTGTVRNADGSPAARCIVQIEGTANLWNVLQDGVMTDEAGRFETRLPTGRHLISLSPVGIFPERIERELVVADDKAVHLDLRLPAPSGPKSSP